MDWHHNLTLSNPGNIQPDLYLRGGILYFVGCGDALTIDGSNVINGSFALFAIPINESNGQTGEVKSIALPAEFSITGTFVAYANVLYVAWISQGGNNALAAAYSVLTNNSSHLPIWQTLLKPPSEFNTNVPNILVNDRLLILHLWNLVGLNPLTGQQLFSISYSDLFNENYNTLDGILVNSTFYFVAEFGSPGHVTFNLVGIDLQNLNFTVNVTVATSSIYMSPLQVKLEGSELVVSTGLGNNYTVATPAGTVLWRSQSTTFANPASAGTVSPGNPIATVTNGNWILTSVVTSASNSSVAIQYFEKIYPNNGSLIWIHQFSFPLNASAQMFIPPNLWGQPRVLVIATVGSYMVYRWGYSVGCASI